MLFVLRQSTIVLVNGTMITCMGEIFGGSMRPLSSPCTIIIAPITLQDIPHEVCQPIVPRILFRNFISNGFENFDPMMEVAICNAFPSAITDSTIVYLHDDFSLSFLNPESVVMRDIVLSVL